MSGRRIGSLVAATAGIAFILINAGKLPDGSAVAVRVCGVLAGVVVVALVLRRHESADPRPEPDAKSWRVYWWMVAFEVVLLIAGSRILTATDHVELAVPWVAFVVGVHFIPFAKTFRAPSFRWLAWTLIGLGLLGAVCAVTVGTATGAVIAGVLSGVALLVFALRFGE